MCHVGRVRKALSALPLAAILVGQPAAFSQQPAAQAPVAPPGAAPSSTKTFSQQDLDQILAPIALYPDALIAQIFMATTYPLEVVEAARWSAANPNVKGTALEEAMQKQPWDPSVKALTSVPQVLKQMNDNLSWMQKLGDAFLADEKAVMETVQSLRAKALAQGNLKSTPEQNVKTEQQDSKTIYVIESTQPEVIYVPTYNPYTVYGVWWYPYPPYYLYPPAYVYPPHVAFTVGIFVGAAIWGHCNWHGGGVYVNVTHYNRYNHTNINNPNWNHNVDHRKGVAYADQRVAQKYNRGDSAQTMQNREQFRGRDEGGRGDIGSMDRGAVGDRGGDRAGGAGASTLPASRDFGSSRGDGGGFSGAGNGASTRDASSRGGASRASMGGGGRVGGGGGRRR
jgi:hypothetical protein